MDGSASTSQQTDVYPLAVDFARWVDELITSGPLDSMGLREVRHLDVASRSVVSSIEEASGTSNRVGRCRSLDRSCGSALACAASLETLAACQRLDPSEIAVGKTMLVRIVSRLLDLSDAARGPSTYVADAD